jgi:DNA-binding transcriptional LysR family regulator
MRLNKLDLNQLVVLDAILSERSVKRAAERLFLSPPAASCALSRLRDYFKDELLVQIGKTMVLTPKAETMQKPVRDVLLQIQAITTMDPAFDPATSTRKITIEASDYVMNVFLAQVLKEAWHEAPQMQFDLRLIGTHSHSDLENGEVDMLIGPDFFASPGHPSELLFRDTWSCLTWVGNTDVQKDLSMDAYLGLGHVIIEWGTGRLGRLTTSDERVAVKEGLVRRKEVMAPNFTVVPQMLLGTRRIATVQTRLANLLALSYPLKVLTCPLPMPALAETLQWHKYQEHDPAITWFRHLLRRVADTLV